MKKLFKYSSVPTTQNDIVTRPILECNINGHNFSQQFLVDSGADRTVIPFELAFNLKLFRNFTKKRFAKGVEGNPIICYFYKIKSLSILHDDMIFYEFNDIEIQVPLSNLKLSLLGRDLFEKFKITFKERQKEFILETY